MLRLRRIIDGSFWNNFNTTNRLHVGRMEKVICKGCGKSLELNRENFHIHPGNKSGFFGSCRVCRNNQRNKRNSKYTYFYEITKGFESKSGKIKALDKDSATRIMKIRFIGWTIKKLCTFKYSKKPVVRARRGNR